MAFAIPEIADDFSILLPSVILASQSPGRKDLLERLGCKVVVIPTDSDEYHGGTVGKEVVEHLAIRKMENFKCRHGAQSLPVLTADTLVGCNGLLIGKAQDRDEARSHLELFSGKTHSVYSGFSLWLPAGSGNPPMTVSGSDEALVTFRTIGQDELEPYLATDDWKGAAGSYRIQGLANMFIASVLGDYATVVGLPIQAISAILS